MTGRIDSGNSGPKCKHVFVSGPPRAGTTLLQLVLSAHPMITVTPETRFIRQLFNGRFAPHKKLNQDEIEFVTQLMRSDAKLNSWPAFKLEDSLGKLHQGMTTSQILDSLFQTFAEHTNGGTDYLGNKKDLYSTGYGPYTKKVFPDAKFVYIVRDPRDVTRSIVEHLSGRALAEAAATCMNRDRHIVKMLEMFPHDTLVIRYEDLVSEPERVCRRMCDFLSVPFDEQMCTFYEMNPDGSRLIGVTKEIHPHTTTPFNPDLIGQWKKKRCFTAKELQTIEAIAGDYMKRYGYKPEAPPGGITAAVTRLKMLLKLWYQQLRRGVVTHLGRGS
jgi:hypothetical protein